MKIARRIEINHVFAASAATVFDAFLDPLSFGAWMFRTPTGQLKRAECDPRVGGKFRIDERRGETAAAHHGEFLEIERPRRIVFAFATAAEGEKTVVKVAFAEDGDHSLVTLTHDLAPEWTDFEERVKTGWAMILENLARNLGGATAAPT